MRRLSVSLFGALAIVLASPPDLEAEPRTAPTSQPVLDAALTSLQHQVEVLLEEGRSLDALKVADRLVEQAQPFGMTSQALATAYAVKGSVLMERSSFAPAADFFEKALAILDAYEAPTASSRLDLSRNLVNLGVAKQLLGDLAEAEKLLNRALAIQEKLIEQKSLPEDNIEVASTLIGLAKISQVRREFRTEQLLWERALAMRKKLYRPNHYNIALALEGLAGAIEAQGRHTDAEPLLREALRYRSASQNPNHPHLASVHQRLATNLKRQGRAKYKEAERLYRKALEIRSRSSSFPADNGRNMVDLALLYADIKEFAQSKALLEKALDIYTQSLNDGHPWIAEANLHLALVEDRLGHTFAALARSRVVSALYSQRPPRNATWSQVQYRDHVQYAWHLYPNSSAADRDQLEDEAFVTAQRGSVTLAAASAARMSARLAAREPTLQALVRKHQDATQWLVDAEAELVSALATSAPASDVSVRRIRIEKLTSERADLERTLRTNFPQFENLIRPAPLSLSEARQLLEPDEALLFVFTTYRDVFVWALTREASLWSKARISADELEKAVADLRRGLVFGPADDGASADKRPLYDLGLAHTLYQKLFSDLDALIRNKPHILYVPTGPLSVLPLHVLVKSRPPIPHPTRREPQAYKDADWLIRSHDVSVMPEVATLRSFGRSHVVNDQRKPLLGFADAIYDPNETVSEQIAAVRRGGSRAFRGGLPNPSLHATGFEALKQFKRLTGTRDEIEAVAETVGADKRDLYLDRSATEATVKRLDGEGRLLNYRILYFATHGIVADTAVADLKIGNTEPALVMTLPIAPSVEDDGLLSSSEIAQLRLNADWVVLSACDTAAGQSTNAEALSGLARAFFYAGARAILVTHWGASDLDTVELMSRMFREIHGSHNVQQSVALKRAMLSRIDGADPGPTEWDAYPSYWGPFAIVVAAK